MARYHAFDSRTCKVFRLLFDILHRCAKIRIRSVVRSNSICSSNTATDLLSFLRSRALHAKKACAD
jgi:hypothetical protein